MSRDAMEARIAEHEAYMRRKVAAIKEEKIAEGCPMPKKGDPKFMEFCDCGRRYEFRYGIPANTYRCDYCGTCFWV